MRTLVSYVPSRNVLRLRRLSDLPRELIGRPHEADYLAFRHFTKQRPKVVDVGANRGQAIVSLRAVLENPEIWSFEPNKELARYLARRFASHQVQVYPTGLGASNRTLPLYIPKYGHTLWDTRASVYESEARRHLSTATFWRFSPLRASVVQTEIDIGVLDDFHLEPDILKIDVEGAEADVIRGGLDTIEANLPVIFVEGIGVEIEQLLEGLGYRRYRYDVAGDVFVEGQSGRVNTFLMRAGHLSLFDGST
jgi:FkbM family methyltransferase